MKMSPLHLEHLLGFKPLCLVMRASPCTARTGRHQLSHWLSCTSCMLSFGQATTTCNQLASPGSKHKAAGPSWPGSLQGHTALGLCRLGSSWGPHLHPAWLGHSPGPFLPQPPSWRLLKSHQMTGCVQRCMVSLHAGTYTQLRTNAMQKVHVCG